LAQSLARLWNVQTAERCTRCTFSILFLSSELPPAYTPTIDGAHSRHALQSVDTDRCVHEAAGRCTTPSSSDTERYQEYVSLTHYSWSSGDDGKTSHHAATSMRTKATHLLPPSPSSIHKACIPSLRPDCILDCHDDELSSGHNARWSRCL
jgi:hypothetical protein